MKITWEAEDIKPMVHFGQPNTKERHMIGYSHFAALADTNRNTSYVLISLEDGMMWSYGSAEEIANTLTEGQYLPVELLK